MEEKEELSRQPISRVLISVSDKSGIVDLSRKMSEMGIEIISTGGTSKKISESGVSVRPVEEVTNFPEMMDGRVKTLHPLIFGGILGRNSDKEQMKAHNIDKIDMVICNLYPFKAAADQGVDLYSLIEEIDIGGPSLLRAASKNHTRVSVVTDPGDYNWILDEISKGGLNLKQRQDLALKSFRHTAEYDTIIQSVLAQRFGEEDLPPSLHLTGIGSPSLRYGENPHQSSVFYSDLLHSAPSIANSVQVQGKQLSYNNLLDFDAALAILMEFDAPTAVIVKHNNPCGVASSGNLLEAYNGAMRTDPQSAFGGIISFNREVDSSLAREIVSSFKEGIIAPSYSVEALEIFSAKKNLRILESGNLEDYHRSPSLRSLDGGWLLQEADEVCISISDCKIVSKRKPTDDELEGLEFGWKVVKHVKSNAILFADKNRTVGIGAGQMSRIDSVQIATFKSLPNPKGTVMASDAFFPFRDGIDEAAKVGVTAVIQPGGSVRDQEVIDAADEHNIAMLFTGMRHFKH